MADSFATPTHQLVLQKAHREQAPPPFDQPSRQNSAISGRRLVELLQGLGGRAPLVCENDDRSQPHGR